MDIDIMKINNNIHRHGEPRVFCGARQWNGRRKFLDCFVGLRPPRNDCGFTLLEVLIALFIFTILALMMSAGLRTVINAQSGTERSAERLRDLQLVLVRLSRDVEQIVNRPVKTTSGQEAPALVGNPRGFAFTHGGISGQAAQHKGLQRVQYIWSDGGLWRMIWGVLDQAANSPKPSQRKVLDNVTDVKFEYLDVKNAFHPEWPAPGIANQPLPRAVKISLTIADWGSITQLYVIPVQANTAAATPPATQPGAQPAAQPDAQPETSPVSPPAS
jgi:general secretion pathway protein J